MRFIDVHCHLEDERFVDDLDEVIKSAEQSGVGIIINSGTNSKRNRESLALSKKYSLVGIGV